jgi:hypothetical protein
MLEVGFRYEFGELKAGDKFAWQGGEYEKISGNFAIDLHTNSTVEFGSPTSVYLYEVG